MVSFPFRCVVFTLLAGSLVSNAEDDAAQADVSASNMKPPQHFQEPYRQTLHNRGNLQYTAEISVGGQSMRAILDTGSFEMLVLTTRCVSCGNRSSLYNRTRSGNFTAGKARVRHSFGSGVTFSQEAYDQISVGPLVSSHQHFWAVYDAMMPILRQSEFGAIVGVGSPDSAVRMARQGEQQPGRLRALLQESQEVSGKVNHEVALSKVDRSGTKTTSLCQKLGVHAFSVCIGRHRGSPGYFVWNDHLPQLAPSMFSSVEVHGEIHWAAPLTSPYLGNSQGTGGSRHLGCEGGCAAVVDSGTSLIAAPRSVIMEVEKAVHLLHEDCSNLADMPDLVFELSGKKFSLPPNAYIGQIAKNTRPELWDILHFKFMHRTYTCVPIFMNIDVASQLGPLWILGLPFFRKYYTNFAFDTSVTPAKRYMHMALSDDGCAPKNGTNFLEVQQEMKPHQVDLSMLRVPRWVEEAMGKSHIKV